MEIDLTHVCPAGQSRLAEDFLAWSSFSRFPTARGEKVGDFLLDRRPNWLLKQFLIQVAGGLGLQEGFPFTFGGELTILKFITLCLERQDAKGIKMRNFRRYPVYGWFLSRWRNNLSGCAF